MHEGMACKLTLCALLLLFAFAWCSSGGYWDFAATLLRAVGSREHNTSGSGESAPYKFILVLSCWQVNSAASLLLLGNK